MHFPTCFLRTLIQTRTVESCNYCTQRLPLCLHNIPSWEQTLFFSKPRHKAEALRPSCHGIFRVLAILHCQKSMALLPALHSLSKPRFLQLKRLQLSSQTSQSAEFQPSSYLHTMSSDTCLIFPDNTIVTSLQLCSYQLCT